MKLYGLVVLYSWLNAIDVLPLRSSTLRTSPNTLKNYRNVESAQSLFYSDLVWEQAGYLEGHHLGGQAKKNDLKQTNIHIYIYKSLGGPFLNVYYLLLRSFFLNCFSYFSHFFSFAFHIFFLFQVLLIFSYPCFSSF